MAKLRAVDVFTPGSFPKYTYVEPQDSLAEPTLRQGLETPGQIVSLSGPSKSGKTVLVERVVGENLITIAGANIKKSEDLWDRILDWMETPHQMTATDTGSLKGSLTVGMKGAGGIPLIASAEASASATGELGSQSATAISYGRRGLEHVVKEIAGSAFVVLVDDFHYMNRDVQVEAAKALKEAARRGIKICTASVPHRSDDVVRANSELRGRVLAVDLGYWKLPSLSEIAALGFKELNCSIDAASIERFASEAAGSPQLMQQICLTACFLLGVNEHRSSPIVFTLTLEQQQTVLERTAAVTSFRSLVEKIDAGPKQRGGRPRNQYGFTNGVEGDVYRCILSAIAQDPPRLSFRYENIVDRVKQILRPDVTPPVGSSIVESCEQMDKLAREFFPDQRFIDWDEQKQVLDVPDPYLIFYLRWGGHLERAQ